MPSQPILAVIGATGAVGREMLAILESRQFPPGDLRVMASGRSAGREIEYRGQTLTIEELTPDALRGIDLALFSAGGSISRDLAPVACGHGATVTEIDAAHLFYLMARGIPEKEARRLLVKATEPFYYPEDDDDE